MAIGARVLLVLLVFAHIFCMDTVSDTPCQDAAWFEGKCCDVAEHGSNCFVRGSNCYCDISCHQTGDCCSDVDCSTVPAESLHITCAELPAPENGQITYQPSTVSQRKSNRTVAIYSCNQGYSIGPNEIKNRICIRPGTSNEWSGKSTTCVAHSCQAAFPDSGGCCDSSQSASCNVGYDEFSCSCSVDCFSAHSNLPCCPDIGCVSHSCRAAFPDSGGCCDSSQSASCNIGYDEFSCSCSVDCFSADSSRPCCPDIGCVPRTCAEAGLSNGCCQWSDSGCYVPGGECYCDEECAERNNCCPDVTTPLNCPSAVNMILTAKTKPYSRAPVLSRFREGQVQDSQAVRELASELRLMSQAQELSTKQQQAQWKMIMKELQEIETENNNY